MPKQQKEQQLATNRAKLQQAKVEQDERRAEEAAMKRPPGRPKKDSSLTGHLGCGDTERAQGHSLAGALAQGHWLKRTKLQRLHMQSSPAAPSARASSSRSSSSSKESEEDSSSSSDSG